MLVDININRNLIDEEINFMSNKLDTEPTFQREIKNIIKKLNLINDITDLVDKIDIGIYEGYIDYYHIRDYCGLRVDQFNCFNYMSKYPDKYHIWKHTKKQWGTCDNIEQILKKYPELKDKKRKFFIIYHKVFREHQSPTGGFRYEKNGKYIGAKNPTHEYLYDDKHIDFVLLYHIYELIK